MKKILILLLALSVFSVDAQTKKRATKKTAKKTTVAKKETPAAKVVTSTPTTNVNIEVTPQPKEELEPINSLSILNAKSPEAFRVYRDMGK